MKTAAATLTAVTALLCLGNGNDNQNNRVYEITLTNLTHGTILTPPIFTLSRRQIDVYRLGTPASPGLEMVAEGGDTNLLREELEDHGLQDVVQTAMPVMPGQSITVRLHGNRHSRLNLASMILPSNDGFIALNGKPVRQNRRPRTFLLKSRDAGTEHNDEMCDSIPGPQCGGEGFNAEAGEGHVAPHAGIHGEGELSRADYNWGEPVARVTVREIDD